MFSKTIDDFVCDDLGKMAMDNPNESMKVLEIYTTTEKSRSPKQLLCKAKVLLHFSGESKEGTGYERTITMIYQMDKNGDWLFRWER